MRSASLNDPGKLSAMQRAAAMMLTPEYADRSPAHTQNAIAHLANDADLNDAEFKAAVTELIAGRTHVGIDLPSIKSDDKRTIALKIFANRPNPADVFLSNSDVLDGFTVSQILQQLIKRVNFGGTQSVVRALSRAQGINRVFRAESQRVLSEPQFADVRTQYMRQHIKISIMRLANSTDYNNDLFRTKINDLFDRTHHIGLDLSSINSPSKKSIVLAALAQKTGLLSLELNASRSQIRLAILMQALTAMNAGNDGLANFSLDIINTPQLGEDAASLAALGNLTRLTRMNISRNRIGDAGVQSLLNIGNDDFDDAGDAPQQPLPNLTSLEIDANLIGEAGAVALANIPKLTMLNVRANQIGDAAARQLAALPGLNYLNLSMNHLSDECTRELRALRHVR